MITSPHEQARFWHVDGLGLLRATYIQHVFSPHAHEEFAIGIIEAGAQTYLHHGRTRMVMPAGCIAVVNPGTLHIGHATDRSGWTYRMFYPTPDLLQRIASEMAGRSRDVPLFPVPIIYDRALFYLLQLTHRVLEDPMSSSLMRESYLTWALAFLVSRHADDRPIRATLRPEQALARQLKRYLEENYAARILLSDLAAIANTSHYHVLRVFKQVFGIPPHGYLMQFRIQQARKLLAQGMPIAAVAAETGFSDQSHFTKVFKRMVGVTPGQF
jgi:AraC-like DNA-binding protein